MPLLFIIKHHVAPFPKHNPLMYFTLPYERATLFLKPNGISGSFRHGSYVCRSWSLQCLIHKGQYTNWLSIHICAFGASHAPPEFSSLWSRLPSLSSFTHAWSYNTWVRLLFYQRTLIPSLIVSTTQYQVSSRLNELGFFIYQWHLYGWTNWHLEVIMVNQPWLNWCQYLDQQ